MLPPDPDCKSGYLVVGLTRIHKAGYVIPNVRLHDVDAGAQLHITPTELLFTALTGTLPTAAAASLGQLRISNWLGEVETTAPAASATAVAAAKTANNVAKGVHAKPVVTSMNLPSAGYAHAYLNVDVKGIQLRTILDNTASTNFGDLGLDTAITGPVKVEWGGPATDIASTVQLDANLTFAPTNIKRDRALNNTPVSGQAIAHYDGSRQVVNITRLDLHTPATNLIATGVLGVNHGDPLTALHVDLEAHDLGEFDQLLTTLDLEGNGKKGTAAIPAVLHGRSTSHGTATGAIANLNVKGHLVADNH